MLRTLLFTLVLVTTVQPPAQQPHATDGDRDTMIMLLDRVQKLAADALAAESKNGRVTVNRAVLDEIVADVAQVKTTLQR